MNADALIDAGLTQSAVREITDQRDRDEISYSRMVEKLRELCVAAVESVCAAVGAAS